MRSLIKKPFSPLLLAAGIIFASSTVFADDTIWSQVIDTDDLYGIDIFEGEFYIEDFSFSSDVCPFDRYRFCQAIIKHGNDGELSWVYGAEPAINSDVLVDANGVAFSEDNENFDSLTRLSLDNQQQSVFGELLSIRNQVAIVNPLASDTDGYYTLLYPTFGSTTHELLKLDFNGNLLWQVDLPSTSTILKSVLRDEGLIIYFINDLGELLANTYSESGELISESSDPDAIGYLARATEVEYQDAFYNVVPTANTINNAGYDYLTKYNSQNEVTWTVPFFSESQGYSENGVLYGVIVNENGVFAIGRATLNSTGDASHVLARYNFDGDLITTQTLDLPFDTDIEVASYATAVSIHNDEILLAIGTSSAAYLAALAFNGIEVPTGTTVPTTPPDDTDPTDSIQVGHPIALGDINGDGHPEIAVAVEGDGILVKLESIDTSTALNALNFNATSPIIDLKAIGDLNNNGTPEIALMTQDDDAIEIRDSLTGELINAVSINLLSTPIAFRFAPDLNNNGQSEVALLAYGAGNFVVIKDSTTSELLASVSFNPNFTVKDFSFVEDLNGDTLPEIAVLATDDNNTSKFEIRSLNGDLIKNIWLGKSYNSTQMVTLPASTDNQPTLTSALGALQTKINSSGLTVRVMDPLTGDEIQAVNYNANFNPITAKAIPDINSNGTPEIALLGSNTDSGTGETTTKIEVKDSHSGNLVKNIWQNKTVTPIDLTIVADINGNGSPETVTLVKQNDNYKAVVKDSLTGELLDTIAIETE